MILLAALLQQDLASTESFETAARYIRPRKILYVGPISTCLTLAVIRIALSLALGYLSAHVEQTVPCEPTGLPSVA